MTGPAPDSFLHARPAVPPATAAILSEEARRLLADERALLGRLRELLASQGAPDEDLQTVRQAELDLDELFLLVIVGEFNAGKSAFINALVGERVMEEGVTPTTAAITRLRHGPRGSAYQQGPLVEVHHPLDLLRDVAIVDTPGTNAILREHEQVTNHFVPRADLILFVTSADRPFTETERAFMERIRAWGKKVVIVLNKADLLATPQELEDQVTFVHDNVERLLGFSPQLFPVSARLALAAKEEPDPAQRAELYARSGFGPLESFVVDTLDETSRLQLKLASPLGVAERVARTYTMAGEEKLALLAEDIAGAESVDSQIEAYRQDMRRDFAPRLAAVENVLHELIERGVAYLDDTLRLGRVMDLFRKQQLKEEFERVVVADTPQRIDRNAQELIDWMVDQDLRLWRAVTEQVERRRKASLPGGPAERLAGSFEYDRRALLGSLGQSARDVVARHDHRHEATQLAQSVRDAVSQATLLEAGAVGLGAVSMAIAGSVAADVTGLAAASVLAGFGLWVLPRKRAQAKAQFRSRTEDLRRTLATALQDEFERELARGIQRLKDALAPYDRFVRAEHERTQRLLADLQQLAATLATLRARVDSLRRSAV